MVGMRGAMTTEGSLNNDSEASDTRHEHHHESLLPTRGRMYVKNIGIVAMMLLHNRG